MVRKKEPAKERKKRPDEDTFYIDEKDRLNILERMRDKNVSKSRLATACDVSRSAITLLLSTPISKEEGTRGCRFMRKLQAELGLAITAKRPAALPNEVQRRIEQVVKRLQEDPAELEHWVADGEWKAARRLP